jgi:hypothetical protein
VLMGRYVVVVVLAVLVAWPGGAAATGRWSQPTAVARPVRPADVVDSVISGGDAVVAWEDFDIVGTGRSTTTERFALWVASAAIGQPFGASQLLERTDHGPDAAVAASPAGWCAVAWQTGRAIRVALRPPGGTFGAPVTVAKTVLAAPVRVGIDDSGSATVLWSELGTVPSLTGPVRTATVTPAGAVAPHDLGELLPGSSLALAVGAAGQAVAAWSAFPGPPGTGRDDARVALRPAGGQFGPVTTFADPAASLFVAGASIDPAGRATVAVQRARYGRQPGDPGAVEILQGSADGGWGTPQGLDANVQARNVRLVSNAAGDRAATWDINPLDDREVNASRVAPAPAGQPFGSLLLTPIPPAMSPATPLSTARAKHSSSGMARHTACRSIPSHPRRTPAPQSRCSPTRAPAAAGTSRSPRSPPWPPSPIRAARMGSGSPTATPGCPRSRWPRESATCDGRRLCRERAAPETGPSGSTYGSQSRSRASSSPCETATGESSHLDAWAPGRWATRASPSAAATPRPRSPPGAIA